MRDIFEEGLEHEYKLIGYPARWVGQSSTKHISESPCSVDPLSQFKDEGGEYPPSLTLINSNCLSAPGFSGGPLLKVEVEGRISVIGTVSTPLGRRGSYMGTLVVPVYNQEWLSLLIDMEEDSM